MKVGDKIYHKKYAGLATVIQVNVETTSDIRRGKVVKTTYVAVYPDGRPITFHGFNIGKTIFKHEPIGTQMSLFDLEGETNE